ncbi:hypothetical protein SH1V18_07380 [Vallitalea longa]|uniref:AmmeMemoRadiSam system protein B n=1 Tax=Vallitalea longa TaxID=2936439 RepID=A0A9W5YBJ9_9FIRM|nr:AmmeMemoRadiSam system protein B [Vallitalea longa]GKX28258.1 hypothetical protein SH1V18_07380 [Vallitalea longa]
MKRTIISIIILITIMNLSACNSGIESSDDVINSNAEAIDIVIPQKTVDVKRPPSLDSSDFIDEISFIQSINESKLINDGDDDIIAGILPHHGVACNYIASLYKTIAENKQPDIVILIGPNHPGTGPRFQVGNFDFQTREGIIESESNIIKKLASKDNISFAIQEVFEKEHSVGIHMNYIKHYFDNAKVVPITIGETRNNDGITEVAEAIAKEIENKNYIIMASIDFSHYLTLEEANEKDEITKKIIEDSDVTKMLPLSNDHIDSPSSYALLIELLDQMNIEYECKINGHDNSANILDEKKVKETTSYFSVSYISNQ